MKPEAKIEWSREKLQEHLCTDLELAELERGHPGQIRVIAAGRYNARLEVGRFVVNYALNKWPEDGRTFTAHIIGGTIADIASPLWQLGFHRAAETILALRKGHTRYRRNKQAA